MPGSLTSSKRNSRAALAAVALFLFFDFTALALNFWLSWKIEKQAVAINLAGRQRMLSQRMAKVLLQLEYTQKTGLAEHPAAARPLLEELQLTFKLFDDTLHSFAVGGNTRGGGGEAIFLEAVAGDKAQQLVSRALDIWTPYRARVEAVLAGGVEMAEQHLPPAVAHAKSDNLALLGLMNELTTALEQLTQEEAAKIRLYQGIAFLLALANFFGAFVFYGRRLRESDKHRDLLDEIINKISASVMVLDHRGTQILKANQTAEQLFGYAHGGLAGKPIAALLGWHEGNLIGQRHDGSTFLAQAERNAVEIEGLKIQIETISDITERRQTEQHLSSLAYHDLLTRLPNRLLFDDRLHTEIAHARRRQRRLGVLFIDLDKFKPVNDTYGHDIGDLLLQEVAARLKHCLRDSDTLARRGGDEFTAIIGDIVEQDDCSRAAQQIIAELERPFHIRDTELHIGASIGIAIFPGDGEEPEQLVSRADEAMYRAKQQGRGTYRYYSDAAGNLPAAPAKQHSETD